MKIAIDISQIVYGTGVSVYTKELVRALLKVSPEHQYILYAGVLKRKKEIDNYLAILDGSFEYVSLPIPPNAAHVLWNRIRPFKIEALIGNFDVLHTSDWTEPPSKYAKVTTIHDLSPILYPEVTHPKIKSVFEKKIELVKKDNDFVITPSLSITSEVYNQNISSDRVFTIPEAPNPELINAPIIDVKKRFGINGEYILIVGTAERKNLERSIAAVRELSGNKLEIVIVGEFNNSLPKDKDIIYTGYVSTHELSNLYQEALVFLYASLYEGFGLPILESYALKTPVVTSDSGSMKEIGELAAVLVNPYDTQSISDGLKKAILNKKALIKKGLDSVKGYSWEKTALETMKVYKKAYDKN